MKVYDSYRDSGIEWFGKIPSHWELRKMKYLFYISKRENEDELPNVLSLTQKGIIERDISTNEGQLAQSYLGYNIIDKGDIVFNPMDLLSGYVSKSKFNGVISQAYTTIKPSININTNYYENFFQNWYHYKILWHLGKGVSYDNRWTLNNNTLLNLKLPFPPINEQKSIANFLDKKSAQIEEFITKKTKFIKLLKEQKEAIINEAVTKGINRDVEFKDSKIEFFGTIPNNWEIRRLSTIGKFSKGSGILRENLTNNGFPAILYGDIYTKYNIKTSSIFHKISKNTTKKSIAISKNDLLFTGSGETKEDIGKCIVYLGNEQVYIGGDVIIFKQKNEYSLYLSYVLNSKGLIAQKILSAKGEIIVHIYASSLGDLLIPLPPYKEQQKIVEYIESKLNQIDKIIDKTTKEIELIKEYKISLINEVVTGKIKVLTQKKSIEANNKFKRAVLGAYVIDNFLKDKTFGHVKFQKILYMCETVNNLEFESDYKRHAMGPYDPKLLHSIEKIIKRNKWFEAKKENKRYVYYKLEKANNYKKYIDKYWNLKNIDKILKLFKPMNTKQSEIVATLYSAWSDLLIQQQNVNDNKIINEVLNNWHDNKKKISKDRWQKAIEWMKEKQLIPKI